jgi:tetratricopeptide (TPR) repeat protein/2-polyprenyl-3-methyl-5-hydroxy-6-metoxy-1,4-benzoquinol methylase
MNRKDGRAAPHERSAGATSALFEAAVQRHRVGQFAEAEALYRQVLANNPDHGDSLHLLGVLAHQVGRSDAAIDLIGRAIAQDGSLPEPHYNIGLAFAALGRLDDAIAHFTQTTQLQPEHAAAHLNLGNALAARGRWQDAATSYRRVLELDPRTAQAHYNLANVLVELGAADAAIGHYRDALAAKPDFAEAHNNLGTALSSVGRIEEAAACHEKALVLKPDLVPAAVNLGNLLRKQGKLDEAQACYRQALARRPDYAEAHNNLGTMLMASGGLEEAARHFERAVTARPSLAEAHLNLARVLIATGDPGRAVGSVRAALDIRESAEAKLLFVRCMTRLEPNAAALELRPLMIRALSEPWARPVRLAPAAARLLRLDPVVSACLARVQQGWPGLPAADARPDPAELAALAGDALLCALVEAAPISDSDFEQLLTATRAGLLEAATMERRIDDAVLAFYCSIAQQCFINEYVFSCDDGERVQVEALRDRLMRALEQAQPVSAIWVVAVAAYLPLHLLAGATKLLDQPWPDGVVALMRQQVREPEEERALRTTIPAITRITDEVSVRVRRQYEENPYPRWLKAAPATAVPSTKDDLLAEFSAWPAEAMRERQIDEILVAGCGTGQQAVEMARQSPRARLLAIDLSLASLAYAQRMTRALGIENVEYAQADILELGSLGRTFDAVLAFGVLHHTADPFDAWSVLLRLLRPGALMQVALYSDVARRAITAARALVAEWGFPPTADGIRRCQRELMAHPQLASPLRGMSDFYSTSECRDLLFHVQEHRLTLPEIGRFLAEHDLKFLGFELDPAICRLYQARFPADRTMTDLGQWHAFEVDNPDTFLGMYQFWVQAPY